MAKINRRHVYIEKIIIYCFLCSMVISVWAVRTPKSTLGSDSLRTVLSIISYFMIIMELGLSLFILKPIFNIWALLLAIWPVLYWIYIHIWAYEIESFAITSPIIVCVFAMQSNDVKKEVFSLFRKVMVIISFIAIICYVSYMLNLGLSYSVVPYYDGRMYQNYVNFYDISFLYINSTSTRVCGIFNEPGWLGTTIALIICYEKFDYKKMSNWILLVAGILTYSLAFFLIIVAGFVIRNIKEYKKWIPIIAVIIIIMFVLPNINTNNTQINLLLSRFKVSSEGLAGNNRSSVTIDTLLNNMFLTARGLVGYGDGYAECLNSLYEKKQILTIKTEFINFGILGMLFLYVPPLFYIIKTPHFSKKSLCFVICFWLSLYQRPWLYIVSNYMLLVSGVAYLNTSEPYEKINQNIKKHLSIGRKI